MSWLDILNGKPSTQVRWGLVGVALIILGLGRALYTHLANGGAILTVATLDVVLAIVALAGLSYGILRYSRVSSCLILAYWVGSQVFLVATGMAPVSILMFIILAFLSIGALGTFKHHRERRLEAELDATYQPREAGGPSCHGAGCQWARAAVAQGPAGPPRARPPRG